MFIVVWMTGVVQARLEVDVGSDTIVYVTDEPLMGAELEDSKTAIVYVPVLPATALKTSVDP